MSSTNVCVVDGYLCRDSELKYSKAGFAFLNFSIAVKSQRKVGEKWEEHTDWIDCKAIGKRAEGLAKILVKGAFCVVSGHLEQQRWEDKDGEKRSKIVLFAGNVSLGPKPANGARLDGDGDARRHTVPMDDNGDDDIPF